MSTPFKSSFIIPGEGTSPPPATVLCPSDLPLVLLPVRLETRFIMQTDGSAILKVRIYPDKIHIDSHERDLTPDEVTWGKNYWEQDWRAGSDAEARAAAWRQIADRLTAERAAWVVRSLQPTNTRPTSPTPPGQALATPPAYPDVTVAASNDAWRNPPRAKLLPDRWLAVVHSAGQVALTATSKDIQVPLNVGPDPQAPPLDDAARAAVDRGDRLAIDDNMKWMVDFDLAEGAGMALHFTVPAAMINKLDSLLVFGVLRSASAAQTADQLADLLDAHHYTDGLSFLKPGTATNNTEDRRTAYTSSDPGHGDSFASEILASPNGQPGNARRAAIALGLPTARIDATLGHVGHALADDDADMRSMNAALWQVGWGYFLSNMIGAEGGLNGDTLKWARQHYLDHVRCFGPLPALRCGPQPYGILPVTSLTQWQGGTSETPDAALKAMLMKLRDGPWRNATGSVARIGRRAGPDPDGDLVDVMHTDAISASYQARNVFGDHFLQHLYMRLFAGIGSDPAQTTLLDSLQNGWRPRLAHLRNAAWQWNLKIPLVQAGDVSPWRNLDPDYIGDLLNKSYTALLAPDAVDPGSASLLRTLLRHAFLREYAWAAALLTARETNVDPLPLLRDAELVDLVDGAPPTKHWLRQLKTPLNLTGNKPIGDYLAAITSFTDPALPPEVQSLGDFRASLAHLQTLDSESLAYLMQGTLDLSAHRLDAWITSFATKRLAAMRSGGSTGQYIGAYGWVENLTPILPSRYQAVTTPPAGEAGPQLQTLAGDTGFIHAPSMTHAATAALLRNAQLGASDVPSATSPFAIDLSSRRVREANRLLDGVRQGQPLGALLGYRVERYLHDIGSDYLIAAMREVAPLAARSREAAPVPVDSIAANNVVDGLVFNRRWKESQDAVLKIMTPRMKGGTSDFYTTLAVVSLLDDMIDGLSDGLTAEAAYQMARGNTARLAGTLSSIAHGESAPPELEVTRVPRTGTAVTHRLALLMSGTTNLTTPGWQGGDVGVRSSCERLLNFWAGRLLGDASKIRCTVERLDDTSGVVAQTLKFPMSELTITPLDVVYDVDAASDAAPASGALSDLEQQVLYYSRRKSGGFGAHATIRLQHSRPADLAAGETTLFDLLEQARAVRRLLNVTRGADPEDFNPPERQSKGVVDLDDLSSRATHALNTLNTAHKALNTLVTKPATATAEALRAAIVKLGVFGVGPAVPVSVAGEDPDSLTVLMKQAQALLKVSGPRLDSATALSKAPAAADARAHREQLVNRIKTVFGSSFVVLPRFKLDAAGATEMTSALAASTQVQGGDALAANTWFTRAARVRDAVSRLGLCLQTAEVMNAGARLNLGVAQLPFVAGERWVGLPPLPGKDVLPGKLSLVVHTVGTINTTQVLTGLVIDEWTEVVPNASETTAIAFQFDVPDACAPQSVLIAVPPVTGQDWTSESLRQLLMETLDLAKLRAVDTGSLGAAAQDLPGLYLAFNAADHAVSTDFTPLTA